MSLLRDIQNELSRSNPDVMAVLRKCKILASRLGSAEFSQWVEWELGGYPEDNPVPEYRRIAVTYYASFYNIAWSVKKATVPLQIVPEPLRDSFPFIEFRDGLAKAASLASEEGGQITIQRPELIFAIRGKMYPEMECHSVWGEISHIEFEQLLSAVTNRILDFSLKIEAENPDAGEASPHAEPVPHEKLIGLVQNTFYGDVGAIAQGSEHFKQEVTLGVSAEGLLKFADEFARRIGELKLDDQQQRRAALQLEVLKTEASSHPDASIVKQSARSLRSITEGAIGSLLAMAATEPSSWHWINEILNKLSR